MADTLTALQQAQRWFEIADYDPASDFELENWIQQIAKRALIQNAINAKENGLLNELVSELIELPLAHWPFKYSQTTRAITDLNYATGLVMPLGFSDLNRLQVLRKGIGPKGHDAIDAMGHDAIDAWGRRHVQPNVM